MHECVLIRHLRSYYFIGVESFDAKARRSVVEFSLIRCREYVASFTHQDVDVDNVHIWEHQWDQFLTDFYLVCHENSKIQVSNPRKILQRLRESFENLCAK